MLDHDQPRSVYPPGRLADVVLALNDIRKYRTVFVGFGNHGRSLWYGLYGMLGNVWEWVADSYVDKRGSCEAVPFFKPAREWRVSNRL